MNIIRKIYTRITNYLNSQVDNKFMQIALS